MGDLLQRHRQQLAPRIAGDLRHRVVDLQQSPALVRPRRRTAPPRSARPRTRGGTPPAPPASHPRRACARCGRARSPTRRRSRAASPASATPSRRPGRGCRPCAGAPSRSPRAGAPPAPASSMRASSCTRSGGISISRGLPGHLLGPVAVQVAAPGFQLVISPAGEVATIASWEDCTMSASRRSVSSACLRSVMSCRNALKAYRPPTRTARHRHLDHELAPVTANHVELHAGGRTATPCRFP